MNDPTQAPMQPLSPTATPTIVPYAEAPTDASLGSQRLPSDLLHRSRSRLRLVTLMIFFGFASDVGIGAVRWLLAGRPMPLAEALGGMTGNYMGLAWCALMLAAIWNRGFGDRAVMTLGLVFQVGVCMIISIWNTLAVWKGTGSVPPLTWVTPTIVMFPLLAPNPPGRVLVSSLASAATAPAALWILDATGHMPYTAEDLVKSLFGPLTATVFAFVGSRVLYGLGVEVRRGRMALERERQLGSYRLESLIGRGGMGEVWRAKHRMIARPAAIKLIRPEALGGDEAERRKLMERFRREAEATASMRSPHTIEVYDFGQAEDGAFYYVMELLDGVDGETLVERFGALPAERVVHILLQMCESLGEAHERGLIHRDIKPANVFVCRQGRADDFVKVLDFGLVKASAPGAVEDRALTRAHTALGTPAFMSPEQVVGEEGVDARSDLYSMGCVAYWLLTGALLFEADSASRIMMMQVRDVPAPPSERSELPVPEALDRIVMQCLAKDPAERPQSADALADSLRALPMAGDWTAARARAWWDAHLPVRTAGG